MKRLSILFVITLMTVIAVPGFDAEAREYSGPERGKMGAGPGTLVPAAATRPTGESTLEFVGGGGAREYRGPERGKTGLGAGGARGRHTAGESRGEVKPETK
jgi:hypothetical protein